MKFNLLDYSGGRKSHGLPVPVVGGLIIVCSIVLPMLLFMDLTPTMSGFLVAGGFIFGLGLLDDVRGVPYYVKFGVQFIAVLLFIIIAGIQAKPLMVVGYTIDIGNLYYPVVILWMMGVMNAINLIDGLDTLAGGVSIIILAVFSLFFYLDGHAGGFLIAIFMTGALVGFLRSNWPPAQIFLGDTGSLMIGMVVSGLSVIYGASVEATHSFTIPGLVLAFPILDELFVMVFRISQNRNPFVADRNHIHYVLLRRGIPEMNVVLTIYIMTIAFSILAGLSTALPGEIIILLFGSLLIMTILLPRLQPSIRLSAVGRLITLINLRLAGFILRSLRLLSGQ